MNEVKIGKYVPSPYAGDDSEAMEKNVKMPFWEQIPKVLETSDKERVVPEDAGWFVAVVRCNCEKKIAAAIGSYFEQSKIWYELWVPMRHVAYIDKRTQKRRMKEIVFLSTFIFCHVSKRHLNDIRFRSDVYKMLTMPGQRDIYQIPDSTFRNFRRIVENPDLPVTPHTGPLKKGQKVRITEGNMAGVVAYVQRISGKKAVIGNEIKYISGATITIDRGFLEVVTDEK